MMTRNFSMRKYNKRIFAVFYTFNWCHRYTSVKTTVFFTLSLIYYHCLKYGFRYKVSNNRALTFCVTTLTFHGHVTSSVTWPFDSPGAISNRCSIVTESLSPANYEIMDPNHIWVVTWPFWVTLRRRSRAQSIRHMSFPITVPLEPNLYL